MITIIDYGLGNLGSIQNIIKKIGYESQITSNLDVISNAYKLILPGVGSFDRAVQNLQERNLIDIIKNKANDGTPLFGICLGMQLLANSSEEGKLSGLGLVPGKVMKFNPPTNFKVPHMGWNIVDYNKSCALYKGFEVFEETRFYFVHSYHFVCEDPQHIAGTTKYGNEFTSSIHHQNLYGAQFHPEKSHKFGMLLLKNFIELIHA